MNERIDVWDVANGPEVEGRSYAERAAAGAALLDQECPGWERRVDLETLDLGSIYCCILGQVFDSEVDNGWNVGTHALGIGWDQMGPSRRVQEYFGFEMTYDEYTQDYARALSGLENAWSSEVLTRLIDN